MKLENNFLNFLYRAGLFGLNIYLFFKLSSFAMNFARTYTNAYTPVVSHSLIILFGVGFFIVFKNLAQIAVSVDEKEQPELTTIYKRNALLSIAILLVLLLVQIIPEFLLSMSYQY